MEFHGLIQEASRFLGLVVDPLYCVDVASNLALLYKHASVIMAIDLPRDLEVAPVFVP